MPHDAAPTKQVWIVRLVSVVAFGGLLFLPVLASATPPTPLNVLFVANGYYTQETQIYNHLVGLGFTVTKLKDYKVTGTTNLTPYNLIIITEFAPNIPTSGINKIKASGKPLLIVEYWDFWYSYKFGLVTTENCGYVGTTTIDLVDLDSRTAEYLGDDPQVYSASYTVYGISELDLKPGVEPVAWSSESFGEYAVIADRAHKIVATGVYDTRKYTPEAWRLFDELIDEIAPMGPTWSSQEAQLQGLVDSGVISYIRNLSGNEPASTVLTYVWSQIFTYNLHGVAHIIEWELLQKGPGLYTLYPPIHLLILHPPYSDEHDDMSWFMGEQYDPDTGEYSVPFYDPKVTGVDLGVSARIYDRTYFYMGDTSGNVLPPGTATGCASNTNGTVECNDAVVRMASYEDDPANGLDAVVIPDPAGSPDYLYYLPQTIDGVHRNYDVDVWDTTNKPFSVPTGASSGIYSSTFWFSPYPNNPQPITLYLPYFRLWYGTQIKRNDTTDKTGKSWVGCSIDGKTFSNCYKYIDGSENKYAYFSKDNYINVSPVEVGVWELAAMGSDSPAPIGSTGGTLLFASSWPFRCGRMYLAYVDRQDFGHIDTGTNRPLNVKYFTGTPGLMWSTDEDNAAPIFDPECLNTENDAVDVDQQALWDDLYAITAAFYEEKLWRVAAGEESYTASMTSTCDTCLDVGCWVVAGALTGDDTDLTLCNMCTENQVNTCVDHIMNSFNLDDYPWPVTDGFGELSVKLVKFDEETSAYVMLSNHPFADWPEREAMVDAALIGAKNNPITDHSADGFSRFDYTWDMTHVFFRAASTGAPWSWSEAEDTGTPGYGPYIIDEFTQAYTMYADPDPIPIRVVKLWHTTSVWHGDNSGDHSKGIPGAYGVYTTSTLRSFILE